MIKNKIMEIQKYEESQQVEFKYFKQINTFKRVQVNEISLSSNQLYLMYSLEYCVYLVDFTNNKLMQTFETLNQYQKQLQFSNDLKYLAYFDNDTNESTIIKLIEMNTWKKQTILDVNHRSNFGFSLSGKHIFYRKIALDIYNIESTKIEDSIILKNNEILQTKYLNDKIIVMLSAESIEFYHLPKKQFIRSYNMHRYPFYNNICQLSVQNQGLIANFPNSLKQRYMNVMSPQNNKLIFKLDAGFTHWKWIYFKDYYIYQKSGIITIIDIATRQIVQKIERLSSQMIYSNFQFQNNTLIWGETGKIWAYKK